MRLKIDPFRFRLPSEILQAWEDINNEIVHQELNEQEFQQEQKRFAQKRRLETLMMLNCYGFNSGKIYLR